MNRIIRGIVIMAIALGSTSVLAQSITVGSGSGAAGGVVVIPVNFVSGATAVGSMDIDVDFDAAKFSDATGDCTVTNVGQALKTCSKAAGKVRISIAGDGTNALVTGLAANISFTIADPVASGPVALDGVIFSSGNVDGSQELPPGTITVTDGVLTVLGPVYSSNPGPNSLFALGSKIQGNPFTPQNLAITNAGAANTTLTGDCGFHAGDSNPDNVFLLNGATANVPFSVAQGAAAANISVSCDSTKPFNTYNGQFSCDHDGTGAPATPVLYTASCTITDGPKPLFNANPGSLSFEAPQAGDVMPPQIITISNSGEDTTTLSSTAACVKTGTDADSYTLSGGTTYSLLKTGGVSQTSVLTVSCDETLEGLYNDAQISCPHNAAGSPGVMPLTCKVNAAGAAIYVSVPPAGDLIDFTPGADAISPNDPPNKSLIISNGTSDPNDNDLNIDCSLSGDAAIGGNGLFEAVAPGASAFPATFTCDATTPGNFTATYTCNYSTDGSTLGGVNPPIVYPLSCDVRGPETKVDPDPASGTTLSFLVQPGGSGTVSVDFDETLNEDAQPNDAILESCLIDGTDPGVFQVTQPGSFPQSIGSGSFVTVTVEGTDDGTKDSYSATLHCTYSDSDTGPCFIPVGDAPDQVLCAVADYPLVMDVGGDATFRVSKDFADGDNPTLVDVTLSCFTGLPLVQTQTISETQDVNFIVKSFESGELDCTVTEDLVKLTGYTAVYLSGGDSSSTNVGGCNFDNVDGGDVNTCHITNNAKPVDVVLDKVWIVEGSGGDFIDKDFTLTLTCDTLIDGGSTDCGGGYGLDAPDSYNDTWCKDYTGTGDTKFVAKVTPKYPSSNCSVEEMIYDDAVDTYLGDCPPMVIKANQGASCKVTNTVFFEGIPTLNQYGLAILALLMLGMGMVGFRRFV